MTSGFSTIAGSVLTAYINLGVPAQNLITSSVMSIPASIAISKMRLPETQEPVTRGSVTVDRGDEGKSRPVRVEFANCIVFKNVQLTFARQTLFMHSVRVPYLVSSLPVRFCEDLIVQHLRNLINKCPVPMSCVSWPWLPRSHLPIDSQRSLTYRFNRTNGLLTWIGRGFGIHQLTLELIIGYIFYPITFFLGVPRHEILRVSQLLAEKLVANEFAAYTTLQAITNSDDPLSPRAYTIASYALCGFSNLGSLGIQIGVLSALAPSQSKVIARIGPSAMICGFISTLQTAGIMYVLILCTLSPSLIALSSGMLV